MKSLFKHYFRPLLFWSIFLAFGITSAAFATNKPINCARLLSDTDRLKQREILSREMHSDHLSDRIFNANGDVRKYIDQILLEYRLHGNLHIVNTGLENKSQLLDFMPTLGFAEERKFTFGGRASERTQSKWVEEGLLRNLDFYPPSLYLLPSTEVAYQKLSPRDVLFFVASPPKPNSGGRIFLHSVEEIESSIGAQEGGTELLNQVRTQGLTFVTGFVDEKHPNKNANYLQTWQELSKKENIDDAVEELQKRDSEYTKVWKIKDPDSDTYTLMTSISNPGLIDKNFLNLPRIALTAPAFENGYRKFVLGNGVELTEKQNEILMNAYLGTRKGSNISGGDLYLVDNTRTAHSRESFDSKDNTRKVMLGMSGVRLADDLTRAQRLKIIENKELKKDHFVPLWEYRRGKTEELLEPHALETKTATDPRYTTPPNAIQMQEQFSMQVYDAKGQDLSDPKVMSVIRQEFEKYGKLHIINNTQYVENLPEPLLENLGFGEASQFKWGGTHSGRTVRQSLGGGFHTVDKFPAELALLAHNEILYQRVLPKKLLFHFRQVSGPGNGGRTFVHSGELVEKLIRESGNEGTHLLEKLRQHGQLIRTGFLDENHPDKTKNYVRSWQDRFGTTDIDEAIKICLSQKSHFDRAWKVKLKEKDSQNRDTYMLMTEVTIPMFKRDERNGKSYMMFPRIAYDGPGIINGFREFILGNGEDFSVREREILIQAFWKSREGIYQSPGDILLVDNIRFGHSREPYLESDENGNKLPRRAGVVMAEEFYTDDAEGDLISQQKLQEIKR